MKTKKQYFAKCSLETIKQAIEWGIYNTEYQAIKSGKEGCKNGLGTSFRIVEMQTTYRLSKKIFRVPRGAS